MNTLDYLSQMNAVSDITAGFISRVEGIPLTTDREKTVAALTPSHQEVVSEMGFEWSRLWRAEQVHGGDVMAVGDTLRSEVIKGVDGLISNKKNTILGIYVADCGAIYILDQKTKAIGLLHSGKKGTDANILGVAIGMMKQQFGSNPKDLLVTLAPCIRPPYYEIDFAQTIKAQALVAGVLPENYTDCEICTAAQVENYYSYRLEKGNTGRMLALLGRK